MYEDFEDHCWRGLVTPDALETYRAYARATYVEPPAALLAIDLYASVFGSNGLDADSAALRRSRSCGTAAEVARPHLAALFDLARRLMLPIYHTTSTNAAPTKAGTDRATLRTGGDDEFSPSRYSLEPEFRPQDQEEVIYKSRASAYFGTGLAEQMRLRGIKTVIVCGETTSGCVRASVVDAYSHGFHVVVAEEAVFDRYPLTHQVNLFDIHHKYGDVMGDIELHAKMSALTESGRLRYAGK